MTIGEQTIGECDFCYKQGVVVKKLYDNYGEWIMNRCDHGCDKNNHYDSEPDDLFEIISINKLSEIPFYESLWDVRISFDKNEDNVRAIALTRYAGEQEDSLRSDIMACRNRNEIQKLNKTIMQY